MMSRVASEHQKDWDLCLPYVLAAYRATTHQSTSYSPIYLMFAREVRAPADLVFDVPTEPPPKSYDDYSMEMEDRMKQAYCLVRQQLGMAAQIMKTQYDIRVRPHQYHRGQWVLYYNPRKFQGRQQKWERKFTPHLVVKELPPVNYLIQKSNRSRPFITHVDKLKAWDNDNPPKSWLTEDHHEPVGHGEEGLQKPVRGNSERGAGYVGETAAVGFGSAVTNGHLEGAGRLSPGILETSAMISNQCGDGIAFVIPQVGSSGDDDGTTMNHGGVEVHSVAGEYDNEGAGNVGGTVAPSTGRSGINGHLGDVVERISPGGVTTAGEFNNWSGSRNVIGLAAYGDGVRVRSLDDGDDNEGAGHVADVGTPSTGRYGFNEHLGDVVGRTSPAGVTVADADQRGQTTTPGDAGQHGRSTVPDHDDHDGIFNNGVGVGRQRYKSRPNNVPVRPKSYTFGRFTDETTNVDACAGGDVSPIGNDNGRPRTAVDDNNRVGPNYRQFGRDEVVCLSQDACNFDTNVAPTSSSTDTNSRFVDPTGGVSTSYRGQRRRSTTQGVNNNVALDNGSDGHRGDENNNDDNDRVGPKRYIFGQDDVVALSPGRRNADRAVAPSSSRTDVNGRFNGDVSTGYLIQPDDPDGDGSYRYTNDPNDGAGSQSYIVDPNDGDGPERYITGQNLGVGARPKRYKFGHPLAVKKPTDAAPQRAASRRGSDDGHVSSTQRTQETTTSQQSEGATKTEDAAIAGDPTSTLHL